MTAGKGVKVLRRDLDAAGTAYRDAAGLVFDFHALRRQCDALADAAGVSSRVVSRLMRHKVHQPARASVPARC
jgi:integrase